jgi:hypothetical protein
MKEIEDTQAAPESAEAAKSKSRAEMHEIERAYA